MELKTAQDFYNFFSQQPAERWITRKFDSFDGETTSYCALGFLRMSVLGYIAIQVRSATEDILERLITSRFGVCSIACINDGVFQTALGLYVSLPELAVLPTPKERVLKALSIIIEEERATKEAQYRKTALMVWAPVASRVAKWNQVPVTTLGMPELPEPTEINDPVDKKLVTA